ncbi:MAG: hypothetical protein U0984_07360 [Prosthecobacter sp.]|nr:hypothetical protein [Prosthecobacter sp.]
MRLAFLLSLVCVTGACACTIPVFRYALDRWEADKFHLVLPASAAQDTALQDVLRPLRANGKANMDITTSRDPAVSTAELRHSRESNQRVWTGTLDKVSLAALLDSPARQKIVASILAGDSFVWVIADSGSSQDAAEVERIEKRLRFLEQVAALPIQDPTDPDSQLGPGPPLRLKFTTLRLLRDDPAESVLLKMLTGPKAEIDPASTSFAAAVFGKGRVLGAWPLAMLDDATLEDASMFLVGRCGCRMKNENPGWDLLLNVDWGKALEKAATPGAQSQAITAKMATPETVMAVALPPSVSVPVHWPWIAAVGAFVLGAAIWLLLRRAGAAKG